MISLKMEQKWNKNGTKNPSENEAWRSKMARIQTRKGKTRTTYTATVRVKEFPSIARTFDTKGEAKSWAADTEKEMRMGRYQDIRPSEKITLNEVVLRYLENVSARKRPNSERRDKDSATAILNGFGTQISLSGITAQRLATYRDTRLKTVSPSTIQKEFAFLSHMFNIANREWGIQIDNPVSKVSRPKVNNGRTRFLTQEEAHRLLSIAKNSRNILLYPYLLLLMHTGMRPSEAAGLRWSDIDLDGRLVKLETTKTVMRYVPLTKAVEEVLRSMRPKDMEKCTYVFLPTRQENSTHPRLVACHYFKRSFDTARKLAKLEDVHLHDLRHTAASHLLMAGVDLRTLAEILGHKTLQMVHRYTHLLNTHKLKAVDHISSLGVDTGQ